MQIKQIFKLRFILARLISSLGFVHKDFWRVDGPIHRLKIPDKKIFNLRIGYSNTLFNTNSGTIIIGQNVIFGHNCMLLTGRHEHHSPNKKKLKKTVPEGFDINIKDGCWK
jgi:acetyltransferase-like isoleucine patch superfamily enzyme